MSAMKVGRNDPCPCGSGKKYKACCQNSPAQRTPAPQLIDEATRRKLFDAFQAYQSGRLDEVDAVCRSILQRFGDQPDTLHLLGLVAQQQGRLVDALQLIDKALFLAANDSMHSNRGLVLKALGRREEAVQAFQTAMSLGPTSAPVLSNLGSTLVELGRLDEAVVALESAIHVDPRFVDAHTNLGVAMWAKGKPRAALECYKASLTINPSQADVWDRVGVALNDCNETEQAREAFTKAFELDPTPIRRLRKTLLLSHVFASVGDMQAQRYRFEQGLDELAGSGQQVSAPSAHLFCPAIFNLAYQGDDVLPTLRKAAAMYLALCPSLRFRAPHLDRPRPLGRRIRLGFFTTHVHDHAVAHCFSGLVKELAHDAAFEILLISPRDLPKGDGVKPYAGFAGRFVKISVDHVEARQAVSDLELDILVYQDIGMDDMSYFLGYARLARKQCVMGGHPVTTGLPEMDIYVSSALGEYEGSEKHYSEQLVALNPGTALFERPKLPDTFKDRVGLGLPAQGNLYVCPMMLQKIHPDFDEAVAEILSLDKQGHVVFFAHPGAGWEHDLKARLLKRLGDELSERLVFLPWITNRDDFAAINYHAAVVLDPFHFGIGSTAITTFAVGAPFVTWPAAFLRGRVGLVYSRLLDLPECVAESQQAYPALAVRIATDAALRADLQRRILAHADRFYGSKEYLETTRAFFRSLANSLAVPGAASVRESA